MNIQQLLELIQSLKALLESTDNLEHRHNVSIALCHARQSLETELESMYDLIREVS